MILEDDIYFKKVYIRSHIEVQILEVEVENGKKVYKANTNAIN